MNYKIEPIKSTPYPVELSNGRRISFKTSDKRAHFLNMWSRSRDFSNANIQNMIDAAKKS